MKNCIDCNIDKEEVLFWKRKHCSDGLSKFCIDCGKIRNRKYTENNKEKIYKKNKEYRDKNKDKINEKQKELYTKQRDERLEYAKNKREKIKDDIKKNGLSLPNITEKKCTHCNEIKLIEEFYIRKTKNCYTEMCKSCKKKESSLYRKENKEKINLYRKEYRKNNSESLINQKIGINLRKRIAREIFTDKNNSITKLKNDLLDCSVEFLKKWFLYNLEIDNINFKDYGSVWHIDHVIPCSAFDLEDDIEIEQCFHWTNIRPLYKNKNLIKSNKIIWPDIFVQEIRLKQFIKINHIDEKTIQFWIEGALTTAVVGKPST